MWVLIIAVILIWDLASSEAEHKEHATKWHGKYRDIKRKHDPDFRIDY